MRKGDLLFFRTYARFPSHVGIYLGDGKMIHASSRSRRVVVTSIDHPYYRKRFIGAKRIDLLDVEQPPSVPEPVETAGNDEVDDVAAPVEIAETAPDMEAVKPVAGDAAAAPTVTAEAQNIGPGAIEPDVIRETAAVQASAPTDSP
jgi:hypothetical protein